MSTNPQRQSIRLVSLDFDGTIMCYDEASGFFHPDAIRTLNALESLGVMWCTNSGRDVEDQLRVLDSSFRRGLRYRPVGLLCSESLVYERANGTYAPAEPWNSEAYAGMKSLQKAVQARLLPVADALAAKYAKCSHFSGDYFTAFAVENRDNFPSRLQAEIEAVVGDIPNCRISRNGGWVAVVHARLGKGAILGEFGRRIGIPPSSILAVGDHLNDLDMLDGRAAACVGCPGDAADEVVQMVRSVGGRVAVASGPIGTVEVIRHYINVR